MAFKPRQWAIAALSSLSAIAVGACSVVGSTPSIEVFEVPGSALSNISHVTCRSALGSYSIPKSLVHIEVKKTSSGYHAIHVDPNLKRVPENQHTFCLDHLANGFADDSIRVARETSDDPAKKMSQPFLSLVASRAADKSVEVIRKLIRLAFIIASGNPQFTSARAGVGGGAAGETVRNFYFDPFDQDKLAQINQSMSGLGFCIVLGDYSFDVHNQRVEQYCDAPETVVREHPSRKGQVAQSQRYLVPKPQNGIFYRPRVDYPLSVYAKADPGGRDPWRLLLRQWVALENVSPILSVDVGRAAFATRRTGLIFDEGMLQNVCIAKGSEVAGLINIPLDIVYGVIALPTQTIKASINSLDTRKRLLVAQDNLIAAQEKYIEYLSNPDGTTNPGDIGGNQQDLNLGGTTGAGPGNTAVGVPSELGYTPTEYDGRLSGETDPLANANILKDICDELATAQSGTISFDGNKKEGF